MHCIQKVKMKGCNGHLKSKKWQSRYSTWLDTFITTYLCSGMGKKQDILGMTQFFFWTLSETGWVSVAIQYVWLPRDSENWRELFHCCIVVSFLCGIALHHWLCSSSVWPVGNLVWVAAQIAELRSESCIATLQIFTCCSLSRCWWFSCTCFARST